MPDLSNFLVIGILCILFLLFIGFIYLLRDDKNDMLASTPKAAIIKTVYFYLVSLIGLMIVVFSAADLINLGLRMSVFPKADMNPYPQPSCAVTVVRDPSSKETDDQFQARLKQCEDGQISDKEAQSIQNQKDAVRDISLLVVGLPLFLYHWITVRKDQKMEREAKV
jgi:amino acid transporter